MTGISIKSFTNELEKIALSRAALIAAVPTSVLGWEVGKGAIKDWQTGRQVRKHWAKQQEGQ